MLKLNKISVEFKSKGPTFNIRSFLRQETLGGLVLILATMVALAWSNSGLSDQYHHLWHELKLGISLGNFEMKASLQHWINDGLMAVFFFMIGLEIKREVMAGELSTWKQASLPIAAAIGGMLFPAAIFVIINAGRPDNLPGWGIPMATDIAFALGLMSLLGKKVNISLKIFLTALAIADDLGAIMIIAIFYTEKINITGLIIASLFLGVLFAANRFGVRRTSFYAIVGLLGVWLSFMFSGVHATIAGVLIALTIPARPKVSEPEYVDEVCELIDKFKVARPNDKTLLTSQQSILVGKVASLSDDANTPLQKLEHTLHPVAAYFILPLFALANAGVHFTGSILKMALDPLSLGILFGLLLGKFLGISLFSKLIVRMKLARLPEGISWPQVYGMAMLAGIGFTMSLFITDLAFEDESRIEVAKVGIFLASLLSAIIGLSILNMTGGKSYSDKSSS